MNTVHALALARPGGGWGHMGSSGASASMWMWGSVMMLFWTVLVITAAWLVLRAASGSRSGRSGEPPRSGVDRARDILAERYARGEITTEEYHERQSMLG